VGTPLVRVGKRTFLVEKNAIVDDQTCKNCKNLSYDGYSQAFILSRASPLSIILYLPSQLGKLP